MCQYLKKPCGCGDATCMKSGGRTILVIHILHILLGKSGIHDQFLLLDERVTRLKKSLQILLYNHNYKANSVEATNAEITH